VVQRTLDSKEYNLKTKFSTVWDSMIGTGSWCRMLEGISNSQR
jgi:hypothetical protein